MSLEVYFRAFSYATIAVATLALLLAGGLHLALAGTFFLLMVAAWKFEGTKWQLSERMGLVAVLLSIPLFVLDWQYQKILGEPEGRLGVTALAHLIVFLAIVKLLQVKRDRDWVFLYLISFFEVLLAAGLSFSPVFLATLSLYLLCGLSTVIAFEIQKARRTMALAETRLLVPPDSHVFRESLSRRSKRSAVAYRLPFVAVLLFVLIFVLALPLFFIAPRSGSAAITRTSGGLSNFIGFSENVTLGAIGSLKQDNEVVMRVRVEDAQPARGLRWWGVALDEFTGHGWRKSIAARQAEQKISDRGFFRLGTTTALHRLTTQTVFLEPIQSSVLFAAARPVAIQGDFPFLSVDAEGSIQTRRREVERIIYKAVSDTSEQGIEALRNDAQQYPTSFERYLQLPDTLDSRIADRANAMIVNAHARNRYDAAKAIESQLQEDYGYSLQMKASGPDPLADFLFNVKAGHCEYFSTAMAVMLRTHGIAARVVNGFLSGEYNAAASAYTVRQSDAHSWVEVYFPETSSWVTFDPTPPAGKTEPVRTGFAAQLEKYAEAMELAWFQYVVGYDKQEQRSLATSLQNRLVNYRHYVSLAITTVVKTVPSNIQTIVFVGLGLIIVVLLVLLAKRVRRLGWRRGLRITESGGTADTSMVIFYERLTSLLAERGMQRDSDLTPLEFASNLDVPGALTITRAYNRVRFGGQKLSSAELRQIEQTLNELEEHH